MERDVEEVELSSVLKVEEVKLASRFEDAGRTVGVKRRRNLRLP
jgi:hypothetical protein